MAFVNHICTALPEHLLDRERVMAMGKRILKGKVPFLDQALALFANAGVDTRFLVRDVDEILDKDDLTWRNQVFKRASIELGTRLLENMLAETGLAAREIDLIITTSCTGFMIPSVDAYLINSFHMRQDIKRLPITELGCAAGAMALARAREYLCAFPEHRVLVLAIELPSLTYQTRDFRIANLVSAALFGDGAAAVLLSGRPGACELLANQTHFFYDTPDLMGFDLNRFGFKIFLDKKITKLVRTDFRGPLMRFLERQRLCPKDIRHYVFHPGGRRILDTLKEILDLEEEDVRASRTVLREAGNLSSASVIWVLREILRSQPAGLGLMAAFGPGFNAELLTLRFHQMETRDS